MFVVSLDWCRVPSAFDRQTFLGVWSRALSFGLRASQAAVFSG